MKAPEIVKKTPDQLAQELINDLKATEGYISAECFKLSQSLGRIVTTADPELQNVIKGQLQSEDLKAINLPSTESAIRKKIASRIKGGDSADSYAIVEEAIIKNRTKLEKALSSNESIATMIHAKVASDLLNEGITLFTADGGNLYSEDKIKVKDKILKDTMAIPREVVDDILVDPLKRKGFTTLINQKFNKYFTTQDKNNPLLNIYNPEKLTQENIKLFNKELKELKKELLVNKILNAAIEKSGLTSRSTKIIDALAPALEKFDQKMLSNQEYIKDLTNRIGEFLEGSSHKNISLENTIKTDDLTRLAKLINDERNDVAKLINQEEALNKAKSQENLLKELTTPAGKQSLFTDDIPEKTTSPAKATVIDQKIPAQTKQKPQPSMRDYLEGKLKSAITKTNAYFSGAPKQEKRKGQGRQQ